MRRFYRSRLPARAGLNNGVAFPPATVRSNHGSIFARNLGGNRSRAELHTMSVAFALFRNLINSPAQGVHPARTLPIFAAPSNLIRNLRTWFASANVEAGKYAFSGNIQMSCGFLSACRQSGQIVGEGLPP